MSIHPYLLTVFVLICLCFALEKPERLSQFDMMWVFLRREPRENVSILGISSFTPSIFGEGSVHCVAVAIMQECHLSFIFNSK